MDLGLKGLKAIVTGGKRGLGRATADVLASEGCDVAICARDEAGVKEAIEALSAHGTRIIGDAIDVADADAYKGWLSDAVTELGGADIFVHNVSGASGRGEEAWVNNLNLDVYGLTRAVEVLTPALQESGRGAIVCLSSIAAIEEFAGPASFGPMKAAMTVYASNLSQFLAPKGIRVNTISPGPVEFEGGNWPRIKAAMPAFYESTLGKIPLGRMGSPDDVAKLVAFLASPSAGFITGANVVIDGGFTRRVDL